MAKDNNFLQRPNSNYNTGFTTPSTGSKYLQDLNVGMDPNASLNLNPQFDGGMNFSVPNSGFQAPSYNEDNFNFDMGITPNMAGADSASGGIFGMPWLTETSKGPDGNIMQNTGALNFGFDAASSIGNLYMGLESLGLAKDQFGLNESALRLNFENQAQGINDASRDKALASYRMGGDSVDKNKFTEEEYVADYMKDRTVSGKLG